MIPRAWAWQQAAHRDSCPSRHHWEFPTRQLWASAGERPPCQALFGVGLPATPHNPCGVPPTLLGALGRVTDKSQEKLGKATPELAASGQPLSDLLPG